MERRLLITAFLVALVTSTVLGCSSSSGGGLLGLLLRLLLGGPRNPSVGGPQDQCPDPNSYGKVCIQHYDQCQSSLQCGVGQQCCEVAACGRECVAIGVAAPPPSSSRLTCPPPPPPLLFPLPFGPCQDPNPSPCQDDSACAGGQLCCHDDDGCSIKRCRDAAVRRCPSTAGLVGACLISCQNDAGCADGKLCCSNGCGRQCTAPDIARCPPKLLLQGLAVSGPLGGPTACRYNSDCASGELCCGNKCAAEVVVR